MAGEVSPYVYPALAVALVSVGWWLFVAVVHKHATPWIAALAVTEIVVMALLAWLVWSRFDRGTQLDYSAYPVSARIVMAAVCYFCGSLLSHTGSRRWRSAVDLRESRAAVSSGLLGGADGPLSAILPRVAFLVIGLMFALPEVLL